MIAIYAYSVRSLSETLDPINFYSELVKGHGTVLFTRPDNKLGRIEIRKG